jgi:hypothetical protein
MKDLTLIIPAKNERGSLPIFLDELKKYSLKIIIVLSKDDFETLNAITNYGVKFYIKFLKVAGLH